MLYALSVLVRMDDSTLWSTTIVGMFLGGFKGLGESAVWLAESADEEMRERPFLQGSEQMFHSRAHSASRPPVHFVPCPHVSPFSPQALLTRLSRDGITWKSYRGN